jgi:hypothetical protein
MTSPIHLQIGALATVLPSPEHLFDFGPNPEGNLVLHPATSPG